MLENVPGGQRTHALSPELNEPGRHAVQFGDPCRPNPAVQLAVIHRVWFLLATVSAGQGAHTVVLEVAATVLPKHGRHVVAPELLENVPGAHVMHTTPSPLNDPGRQTVQFSDPCLPKPAVQLTVTHRV